MRFFFAQNIWRKLSSRIHSDHITDRITSGRHSKLPASDLPLFKSIFKVSELWAFTFYASIGSVRALENKETWLCSLSQTLRHMSTKHLYPSDRHRAQFAQTFRRFDCTLINTPGTLKSQTCWSGFACQFSVIFK